MPRGAYACKVDDNQKEIVKAFRDLGASVLILSSVGHGCPDLLIGIRDIRGVKHNLLVEIKDGKKFDSQQQLTKGEKKFFDSWNGQVTIINSLENAISFLEHHKFCRG